MSNIFYVERDIRSIKVKSRRDCKDVNVVVSCYDLELADRITNMLNSETYKPVICG